MYETYCIKIIITRKINRSIISPTRSVVFTSASREGDNDVIEEINNEIKRKHIQNKTSK